MGPVLPGEWLHLGTVVLAPPQPRLSTGSARKPAGALTPQALLAQSPLAHQLTPSES